MKQLTDDELGVLNMYVKDYCEKKAELTQLENTVKGINSRIKQLFNDYDIDNHAYGDYEVSLTVSKRESFDEDKLLRTMKIYAPQTIQTKEYVDMDILESEIYHGKLSDDVMLELDRCKKSKLVETLNIKKPKGGKK